MKTNQPKQYFGINIYQAAPNAYGFRWTTVVGNFRAQTLAGMKRIIKAHLNAKTK